MTTPVGAGDEPTSPRPGDWWRAPAYGRGSLADVLPAVATSLGVPGMGASMTGPLALPRLDRWVVLLIDGLGSAQLGDPATREIAPYLSSMLDEGSSMTCGVPSTTTTSLTSLGTGLPPGQHGVVGYTQRHPATGGLLAPLTRDASLDLRTFQPHPTVFRRAARDGVVVRNVNQAKFAGSTLTAVAFGGADARDAESVDERVDAARFAVREGDRSLVYVYDSAVDHVGHGHGWRSERWRSAVAAADELARRLRAALPRGAGLLVTADHGMVDVPAEGRVDLQTEPGLDEGIELIAGEGRFRHLYVRTGAADDVHGRLAERLGDGFEVLARDEGIERGWFGAVADGVRDRVGDVLVVAIGDGAVLTGRSFPGETRLVGMHGSLTPAEMEIPLLLDVPA